MRAFGFEFNDNHHRNDDLMFIKPKYRVGIRKQNRGIKHIRAYVGSRTSAGHNASLMLGPAGRRPNT